MSKRKRKIFNNQEKIDYVFSQIQNIADSKKLEIIKLLDEDFISSTSGVKLVSYTRKHILNITKPYNRSVKEYWILRGWSEKEAKHQSKKYSSDYRKDCVSPFSNEFWLNKGYTLEESEYIRNSKRPIRKEYWIERGFSEDDAIVLAKNKKDSNNKAGSKKAASRSKEELRRSSNMCIEYYLDRGFSEDEAKIKIKERQRTFTLEKCKEKHGDELGFEIWKQRQEKWVNTLKNKSEDEQKEINSRKSICRLELYDSVEDCISKLKQSKNMDLFSNIEDYMDYFLNTIIKKKPYIVYHPIDKILNGISTLQKEIIPEHIIRENIEPHLKPSEKFLIKKSNKQSYRRWEENGLLRSSYEIYFYDKFIEYHPNTKIHIDKPYPNSNFRYDFLIDSKYYIEICPMFGDNDEYTNKMMKKQKVFGSILLKTIEEIDNFIESF